MKQTAVEWLYEKHLNFDFNVSRGLFVGAEELERELILEAFLEGNRMKGKASETDAQQYFNKTFRQEK